MKPAATTLSTIKANPKLQAWRPNCPHGKRLLTNLETPHQNDDLEIQKPTVLRVLPSNYGVITYYSVGFGVTGEPET